MPAKKKSSKKSAVKKPVVMYCGDCDLGTAITPPGKTLGKAPTERDVREQSRQMHC